MIATTGTSTCVASGRSANQLVNFAFPKHSFGSKGDKRSFNSFWFQRWPWLDYNEANDSVVCFFCSTAEETNLLPCSLYGKRDLAFITKGVINLEKRSSLYY